MKRFSTFVGLVTIGLLVWVAAHECKASDGPMRATIKIINDDPVSPQNILFTWFSFYDESDHSSTFDAAVVPAGGTVIKNLEVTDLVGIDGANIQALQMDTSAIYAGHLVGASYVVGTGDDVPRFLGYANFSEEGDSPQTTIHLKAVVVQDGRKTLWKTADTTLTANLFREGIDKIVDQFGVGDTPSSGGGGGGDMDATNALLTEIKNNQNRDSIQKSYSSTPSDHYDAAGGIRDQMFADASTKAAALEGAFGAAPVTSATTAHESAGNDMSFGNLDIKGVASHTWTAFKPFAYSDAFASAGTDLQTLATLFREIVLWVLVTGFWFFARGMMEKHYLATLQTPQLTTKTETSQIAIPGVGWGKQLVTSGGLFGILVIAIAAAVLLMNTGLGTILVGTTYASIGTSGQAWYGHLSDTGGGMFVMIQYCERFFPMAAALELVIAKTFLSWSMPLIFAACQLFARLVHL